MTPKTSETPDDDRRAELEAQKDTTPVVAGLNAKMFGQVAAQAEPGSALWAEMMAKKLSAEGQVTAYKDAADWEARYGKRDGGTPGAKR